MNNLTYNVVNDEPDLLSPRPIVPSLYFGGAMNILKSEDSAQTLSKVQLLNLIDYKKCQRKPMSFFVRQFISFFLYYYLMYCTITVLLLFVGQLNWRRNSNTFCSS